MYTWGNVALKAIISFTLLIFLAACGAGSSKDEPSPFSTPLTDPVEYTAIESALEKGDLITAKNLLERAALAKQSGPKYQLLLAEFHLANGSATTAAAEFERLKDDADVSARAHQGLGLARIYNGQFDDALDALLTATTQNPDLWRAWNAQGVVYDRMGQYENAMEAYRAANALKPQNAEIINNMGFSHLLNGKAEAAIESFSKAINLRPDLGVARTNLRLAMALKGDYVAALAGANTQELRTLLNNAGVAALARGDYVNAEALLTRAMENSPSFYALAAKNLEMLNALKQLPETP